MKTGTHRGWVNTEDRGASGNFTVGSDTVIVVNGIITFIGITTTTSSTTITTTVASTTTTTTI